MSKISSKYLTVDVDSTVWSLHHVDVGRYADVSEVQSLTLWTKFEIVRIPKS
jgi:hypothetical protein